MNIHYHSCTIFVKNSPGNIAFTTDLFMGDELNKLVFILRSSAGVTLSRQVTKLAIRSTSNTVLRGSFSPNIEIFGTSIIFVVPPMRARI